jgi:hypothetical protein
MESEIDVLLCMINKILKYVKFDENEYVVEMDNNKNDSDENKDKYESDVNKFDSNENIKMLIKSFCENFDLNYDVMIEFFRAYIKFIVKDRNIREGIIAANASNLVKNTLGGISIEGLQKCNYKYKNVHLCLMLGYPYNFAKRISNIDGYFNVYAPSTSNISHLATMKYKGPKLQLIINPMYVTEYIFYLYSDMDNKSLFVSRVNKSIFSEFLKHVYKRDVIKKNISDVMQNYKYEQDDEIEYKVAINFINAIRLMLSDLKKLKL